MKNPTKLDQFGHTPEVSNIAQPVHPNTLKSYRNNPRMGCACLGLKNLGVILVYHLVSRLGVHHVAILGVYHDVRLDFRLICRSRDLGAAN